MSTDLDRLEHNLERNLERRLERRGAQRFEVNLPLAVRFEGRTVPGFTQDLSGRGIFFYAETNLPARRNRGIDLYDALRNYPWREYAGALSRPGIAGFSSASKSAKRDRAAI